VTVECVQALPDIKANEIDPIENVVTTNNHAQICNEEILSIKAYSLSVLHASIWYYVKTWYKTQLSHSICAVNYKATINQKYEHKQRRTFSTPTIVVVRAELWLVQTMMEYMSRKPIAHDNRKYTTNTGLFQSPYDNTWTTQYSQVTTGDSTTSECHN